MENETQTSTITQPEAVVGHHAPTGKGWMNKFGLVLATLVVLGGVGFGGYTLGKNSAPKMDMKMTTGTTDQLTVPKGATQIAKCEKGKGAQYVLPKDIPGGPIYDIYQGKVIGVEHMVASDELAASATKTITLDLMKQKYDHIAIDLESEGHAGFIMSHYHIDALMVPTSTTDKITCGDTPTTTDSSMSHMHM